MPLTGKEKQDEVKHDGRRSVRYEKFQSRGGDRMRKKRLRGRDSVSLSNRGPASGGPRNAELTVFPQRRTVKEMGRERTRGTKEDE